MRIIFVWAFKNIVKSVLHWKYGVCKRNITLKYHEHAQLHLKLVLINQNLKLQELVILFIFSGMMIKLLFF